MATLANQSVQGNQAPNQVGGNASTRDNNSMFQGSVSSAALAANIIYAIMALYAEITKLGQEQRVNMVTAQAAEAKGQADATKAAGDAQLKMGIEMGLLTAGGALAGMGVSVLVGKMNGGSGINEEIETAGNKVAPMKIMDDTLTQAPSGAGAGAAPPALDAAKDAEAEALSQKFERNDFSGAKKDDEVTKAAVTKLQTRKGAVDFATWKQNLADSYGIASQDYNTAVSKNTSLMSTRDSAKNLVSTAGSSASNIFQGIDQQEKAGHDANAALYGTATQQAGSASGDMGQVASKAFDSQNAEIQVLMNILRTGSVNGG